jgi:hypothetical protein
LTIKITDIGKRLDKLEARDRDALPSILIVDKPLERRLKPEVAAALAEAGATCIVLPVGRSALPYEDGAVDPQIAVSRKYFT